MRTTTLRSQPDLTSLVFNACEVRLSCRAVLFVAHLGTGAPVYVGSRPHAVHLRRDGLPTQQATQPQIW